MAVNKELLLKVNDWVQAEDAKFGKGKESEWDQTSWACGTACCFAGKVVLEAGGTFIFGDYLHANRCVLNGYEDRIEDAAIALLGIGDDDAEDLFSGGSDAYDIDRKVRRIVAENP